MQVFVLQAQGYGDDEDAFYTCGVYSTRQKADDAALLLRATDNELVSEVEEYLLDL
jgi:hypothetical protein